MQRSSLFGFMCIVAVQSGIATAVNRGYIFTIPKRLIAGEINTACISLHGAEPPLDIILELLPISNNSPIAATPTTSNVTNALEEDFLAQTKTSLKSGWETCLELRVSSNTKQTFGKLRLRIKFSNHPDYLVEAEKKIAIEHDELLTFVETDKPVYKPAQDVNIRVLVLKRDLKPWTKSISKIWIENPSEVRVVQWTNVSTDNGMAQLLFPLSPEPSSGIWKIKVEKTRPQLIHVTSFEVKKYVLPRFQVTISPPPYILADANDATWRICSRYSYGAPVKGTLKLSLRPQTPIWKRRQTNTEIKHEEKFDSLSDGCFNYTVSAEVLGLPQWKIAPNTVILMANFIEAKTAVEEAASSRTLVMHQPLKIEFSPHTSKYFKPGLPYNGKVRVLKPDGTSPAPKERIQICLRIRRKGEWQRHVLECRNFTSTRADGFLEFTVPPQGKNILLLSFVATAVDYPTKYYSPDKRWRVFVDQPSAYIDVEPWFSPTSSYLLITEDKRPIICGEKFTFNVLYTSELFPENSEPAKLYYSINSKGNLLMFDHVSLKKRNDSILKFSGYPNLLGTAANSTNSTPIVYRYPLVVKITPELAPISGLLVYYVRIDGEVVTASYSINVDECFENKVRSSWSNDKQTPGSKAKFNVQAAPDSLCGISAVDKSTKFLSAKQNLLDAEVTFNRLREFHLSPESSPIQTSWAHCDKSSPGDDGMGHGTQDPDEEIDHLPRPQAAASPKIRRKRHSVTYTIGANYVDAIQAFDDFGTVVMSDLTLETRPCPPWRSNFHADLFGGSMQDVDEPDRMLKAVKAMPLAFQFAGAAVADSISPGAALNNEISYVDPLPFDMQVATTLRLYFPETWLWDLVPVGPNGTVSIELQLPHTITEWVSNAVCISKKSGLGISPSTQITGFQPFFLDYNLPYSVKRGEHLKLKVSLFNYMHHSLPVRINLAKYEGFEISDNSLKESSFCVNPKDSVYLEFPLVAKILGEVNVTVVAEIASNFAADDACGPEMLLYTSDSIVKPILVKAEGFPVEITNSAFLCPKDFNDDSLLSWNLAATPKESGDKVIEGSVKARVTLIGDVFGPSLDNLDQLVRLPMGCGEQNMILFVPNIHAISYLDAVSRHTSTDLRERAIRNMQKGYQRELNYRHPDGSYSAFGSSDEMGSMWLTAFVVKSFAQARSLIQIDERDLKLSVKWIVRRQLENGCFPVVGQVFHKDMKGGLREEDGSSSALTAYVLIALLESGVPLTASLVNNALYCLEKASTSDHFADNPYTAALTTYALALLEHPRANESLRLLMNRATSQNGLLWWEDKNRASSIGLSIEMTSYSVLSLVKLGGEANMLEALKAIKWMSKKRNVQGGFTSTQDTVIGLESLTKYATTMVNASATDLSVLLVANQVDRLFKINDDNKMVLYETDLPTIPTSVEVFAEGNGCLLVQSVVRYHKSSATGSEAFDLSASSESVANLELENLRDKCSQQKLNVCARYKLPDEESNMAVLEVEMVTGFVADKGSLQRLLSESSTGVKRYEESKGKVAIYFDKLTGQKTCISFVCNRENVVENAEPGNIVLYDYYQQELSVTTTYAFASVCVNGTSTPTLMQIQKDDNKIANPSVLQVLNRESSVPRGIKFDESLMQPKLEQPYDKTTVARLPDDDPIAEGSGEAEPEGRPEKITFNLQDFDREVTDKEFLPAFVNVDHELNVPSGVEGVPTVYVPAPTSPMPVSSSSRTENVENNLGENPSVYSSAKAQDRKVQVKQRESCPRCEERLPPDIKDLYCSSASVVKIAIRRSRKTRLLLDLTYLSKEKRLHGTIEFTLKPECICKSLDRPGTLALLLSKDPNQNYAKYSDKTKAILKHSSSLFTLPTLNGVPNEIIEAQQLCFSDN